jgi:hypothetical protein
LTSAAAQAPCCAARASAGTSDGSSASSRTPPRWPERGFGTVLRVDRTSLRSLDAATLGEFLADAGFEIAAQFGDGDGGPVTATSREIITTARRT